MRQSMLLIESTFELAKLSEEEIKTRSRIKNFVIDSRQVKKNSVFIALKGNNLDGNDFRHAEALGLRE